MSIYIDIYIYIYIYIDIFVDDIYKVKQFSKIPLPLRKIPYLYEKS